MIHLTEHQLSRFLRLGFWAALLFTFVCAVMPADVAPQIAESDKVEHFIAFSVLSLIAALAYWRVNVVKLGLLLSIFGALIELIQAIPILHRDADVWDWATDTAAIVLVILSIALARWRQRRCQASAALRQCRQKQNAGR